jgi:hypothetical protein
VGISKESCDRIQFYIGDDHRPAVIKKRGVIGAKGIAGHIFLTPDPEIRIVHFREENGRWTADDNHYYFFDPNRRVMPYLSSVSVPVFNLTGKCIAVLCFDSISSDTFDPKPTQALLLTLASRVATVLLIYYQLLDLDRQKGGLVGTEIA